MKNIVSNKLFMATFIADMVSNFGDTLYYLALMNYVLLLPEAKFALSLVSLSEGIPYLTMILLSVWGDKTKNKVDSILSSQVFRVFLYSILGLTMGFEPALWIVFIAIGVNILSDLAGQYENALYTPLSLRIVSMDERESMYAFKQGTSSVLQVLFQSSGAFLLTILNYQNLAFLNAATFAISFFIMLVLRPHLIKLLKDQPIQPETAEQVKTSFVSHTWQTVKDAYQVVQSLPLLRISILTIAVLNALFGVQTVLLLMTIKEDASFALVNPATTLASLTIILLLGRLLGSVLVTTIGKHTSMVSLLTIAALLLVPLFLAFLLHQIYLVFAVNFLLILISGLLSPKLNAYVTRQVPENRLATIGAGIDSFCTLGIVLASSLMSGLVALLSAHLIALLFFLSSLVLAVYACWIRWQSGPVAEK